MTLPGVNEWVSPFESPRAMRTGITIPEGGGPAHIHEGVITDVNMLNWTVDFSTTFDQRRFPNIQVASPYLHPRRGAGIFAVPEIGAKGLVCLPSDGFSPFLLCYVMPEVTRDDAADGEPGFTYAGGRARYSPGDIIMRGEDGNTVVLRRGGVIEIGSTALARRFYIPISNVIADICSRYEMHSLGGNIRWGVLGSSSEDKTGWVQTFRLLADSANTDVRVAIGSVEQPTLDIDTDETTRRAALGVGTDSTNPLVVDIALAPAQFTSDGGAFEDPQALKNATKMRLLVDKTGNVYWGSRGGLVLNYDKGVNISTKGDMNFEADGFITFRSKKKIRMISEGGFDFDSSGVVGINGGSKPVASVGSTVTCAITVPIPFTGASAAGPVTGTLMTGGIIQGQIKTGNPTIKV